LVKAIINRLHLTTCVRFDTTTTHDYGHTIVPGRVVGDNLTHAILSIPAVLIVFKEDKIILILVELYYHDLDDLKLFNNYVEISADLANPNTEPLYLIHDIAEQITQWYRDMLECDIRVAYI